MTQAYPLQWPAGWPRLSTARKSANFSKKTSHYPVEDQYSPARSWTSSSAVTIDEGTKRIVGELRTMGVRDGQWVISTDLELRNDGLPRSNQLAPADPGAAVYWTRKGKQQVMAIDIYDRVADNLAAIAASLSALRAIERHGGAQILDRAFEGFTALPAPDHFDPHAIFGFPRSSNLRFTRDTITSRYRELAKTCHPDAGGDAEDFKRLQRARDALLKEAI